MMNLDLGPQNTGIYAIVDIRSGHRYIGSTQFDFEHRWDEHKRELKRGKHTSPLLQEAFDRNGDTGLKYEIRLICQPEECIRYEQYFLDVWRGKKKLFNANRVIEWLFSNRAGRGYISPHLAYEQKEKIRQYNILLKGLREAGKSSTEAIRIADELIPIRPISDG